MNRFTMPRSPAQFSPDQRYFAVVTSRGLIQSDEIESTLWIFPSAEVRKFLHGSSDSLRPLPKMIARMAAVPRGDTSSIYESLISDLRWSDDSKAVFFLGKGAAGKHRLYKALRARRLVIPLSPRDRDVGKFDLAKGHIVYSTGPSRSSVDGETITEDARDVSGLSLESILLPKPRSYPQSELWVVRDGRNAPLLDPASGEPLRFWNYPPMISLSPDGHLAVIVTASDEVPSSWKSYEPAMPYLRIDTSDPNLTSRFNYTRPAQYSLVDLRQGGAPRALVNAPLAWTLGYNGARRVVWSPSGTKVLLTQTFLPPQNARDTQPCAVAIVDLASKSNGCIAFVRSDSELSSVSFGTTDIDVVLQFSGNPVERYHNRDGTWEPVHPQTRGEHPGSAKGSVSMSNESAPLVIEVKQDLNSPPVLWATERHTQRNREIWNPNPQLSEIEMGEASIFRWKDKTGYAWTGGLIKPPDYTPGKRYPLVIQTHGFRPWEFMSDGQTATAFAARALAAAGMMVLQVVDRLDHQVTADEASEHVLGYVSAIDQLASDGLIDRDRVGIIGFSRTCYYVETAIIQSPDRFAAAVIADGVDESYIQQVLFFTVSQASGEAEQIYGGPPFGTNLTRWTERAPGFHVDRIRTPLQIQAIGPTSILMEWELYALLWKQGKAAELVYLPDGQHLLQKPGERIASQQGSVDWFRFWLMGEEDSDSAKRRQYAHWQQMRRGTQRESNP